MRIADTRAFGSIARRVKIYMYHPVPSGTLLPTVNTSNASCGGTPHAPKASDYPQRAPSGGPDGGNRGGTPGALGTPGSGTPPAGGPRGARGPGGVHFRGYLITLPVGTDVALFRYRSRIPPKNFRIFSPPARAPRPGGAPRGPPGTPPGTPPREGPKTALFRPPARGVRSDPLYRPPVRGVRRHLTLDRDTASPEGVVYTVLDALRGCSRCFTVHSALPIDDWSRVIPCVSIMHTR